MFTIEELKVLWSSLVVQEKSVNRLAAKDGQPESVAQEYRKVSASIGELIKKVSRQYDEAVKAAEAAKGGKK